MLVVSYLNDRSQFVICGGKKSSVGRVTCDVPQGSVLGPLLFVFHIIDVSRVIKLQPVSIWICSRYMSGQRLMD
jgi:hypothetical protein